MLLLNSASDETKERGILHLTNSNKETKEWQLFCTGVGVGVGGDQNV